MEAFTLENFCGCLFNFVRYLCQMPERLISCQNTNNYYDKSVINLSNSDVSQSDFYDNGEVSCFCL